MPLVILQTNLRHFESEKFQKYVIDYIILCCNLIHLIYYSIYDLSKTKYIFIVESQKISNFKPDITRMNKRIIIDTSCEETQNKTFYINQKSLIDILSGYKLNLSLMHLTNCFKMEYGKLLFQPLMRILNGG